MGERSVGIIIKVETNSPAARLVAEIKQAIFEQRGSPHALARVDHELIIVVARSGTSRLEIRHILERSNDVDTALILDAVLFDAAQTARKSLGEPKRHMRGTVDFLKLSGATIFAGSVLTLAASPLSPVVSFLIACLGFAGYAYGQHEQNRSEKYLEEIEADIAALDELRKILQGVQTLRD